MDYISIRQACELTGKADKTIRVFVQSLIDTGDKHAKKEGRVYYIDKAFLLKHYQQATNPPTDSELVKELRARVASLEKELERKDVSLKLEQLKTLPEGERRQLMQSLLNQLKE